MTETEVNMKVTNDTDKSNKTSQDVQLNKHLMRHSRGVVVCGVLLDGTVEV